MSGLCSSSSPKIFPPVAHNMMATDKTTQQMVFLVGVFVGRCLWLFSGGNYLSIRIESHDLTPWRVECTTTLVSSRFTDLTRVERLQVYYCKRPLVLPVSSFQRIRVSRERGKSNHTPVLNLKMDSDGDSRTNFAVALLRKWMLQAHKHNKSHSHTLTGSMRGEYYTHACMPYRRGTRG